MMKLRADLVVFACMIVAGCSDRQTPTNIAQENVNPLMAEYYGEELANMLADIIIQNDPLVASESAKEMVQREISKAKAIARVGKEERVRGRYGAFISIDEDTAGEALYVDDKLYLSPTFLTEPGPELHIYLTTAVDPRDGSFPDGSAINLGELQTILGPQTYDVGKQENAHAFRTVVLWDVTLKRLFGFAQLPER